MNLIRDLMEYGELRLWNCDNAVYVELLLEIPIEGTGGMDALLASSDTLESAIQMMAHEIEHLREPTPSQSDGSARNIYSSENRSA